METRRIPAPELWAQRIRDDHPNLVSTGCTPDFCQAGRLFHDDEPRVGKNRALHLVEQEAIDFLETLHSEGYYEDGLEFQHRLQVVRQEIRDGAIKKDVKDEVSGNVTKCITIGGNWKQTSSELEFGIRRAWRNSRKCIMRSHCEDLELCDLRDVTSSVQMVAELLKRVTEAFNGGNIIPTAFVFPPRQVDCRGPMFWNHQILQFAGYENADGSILGDPNSVGLTNAILELGWIPPVSRSPWDLLPLVAMAEGERPAFAEIPPNLRTLVDIRHPQYMNQFSKLALKWVSFPALTRLGFDIGGVQYSAAPFMGWFMDAEIGVRNLADSFRYNALPDIVSALGLTNGKLGHGYDTFDDLPEYEKLSLLSKAQAELNYAVSWSYQRARITMVDSLTASMKWCNFDDDFYEKNGYRLPSDPYWIAPPQGSIIPLWHRGGAPNYQPKPMIARHVQDSIKAWGREKHLWSITAKNLAAPVEVQVGPITLPRKSSNTTLVGSDDSGLGRSDQRFPVFETSLQHNLTSQDGTKTVAIYFCSAGTTAEKLANKLQKWMTLFVESLSYVSCTAVVEPLDSLKVSDLTPDKILLLVVSSTGHGDIPANGLAFERMCRHLQAQNSASIEPFKFAIFGNGDSRYTSTYNEAAFVINGLMKQVGGLPLMPGVWDGDTAVETLPMRALHSWWEELKPLIAVKPIPPKEEKAAQDAIQQYDDQQESLLATLKDATLVIEAPHTVAKCDGSLLLSLNIHRETYGEMSCIQVLPCNSPTKVERALQALCVGASDQMNLVLDGEDPTFSTFLTSFVDLELPFLDLEWLNSIPLSSQRNLNAESLSHLSVAEVLERIISTDFVQENSRGYCLPRDICLAMPLLDMKTYSIASSLSYASHASNHKDLASAPGNHLQIMVKIQENGRFSDTFLNDCAPPRFLKYRIVDSKVGPQLRENYLAPMIVVATGAGFGPVRCLLQWRIATARKAKHSQPVPNTGISLFLGLKECDMDLVEDVINEAESYGILDMIELVVSNPAKRRVYEKLGDYSKHIRGKVVKKKGLVFVCASSAAAEGTKSMFEKVIGSSVEKMLGERYLEDVF